MENITLVNGRETTDSLCRLFFVNSISTRRLIRKRVWTRVREVSFWYKYLLPYWFIWNKDFKWFIKSNSNTFKRKQFILCHLQTDRQAAFFSHDFSWIFFFFSWTEKNILKAWLCSFNLRRYRYHPTTSFNIV